MEWWNILIGVIVGYSVAIGLSAVALRTTEQYKEDGYVDINLGWLFGNLIYFIGQTIFPVIKYTIVLCIMIGMLILVLFLAFMESNDSPDFPDFMENWFYGEKALWHYTSGLVMAIVSIFVVIGKAIGLIFKALFIKPFVWIKNNFVNFSFFTIGKKPVDK